MNDRVPQFECESDLTIVCPTCHAVIKVTESVADLLTRSMRQGYEDRLALAAKTAATLEEAVLAKEEEATVALKSVEDQVAARVKEECLQISVREVIRIRGEMKADLQQQKQEACALQEELREKDARIAEVEKSRLELLKKEGELESARREMDLAVQQRINEGLAKECEKYRIAAEAAANSKVDGLQQVIKDMQQRLEKSEKDQADAVRTKMELDAKTRELEISIEKGVQEKLSDVQDKASKAAENGMRLRVQEKEQIILSLQQKIEELGRKAGQGSQQLQGEVLEIDIEKMLRENFPEDDVEAVPKGTPGADVLQRVMSYEKLLVGAIAWECKNTQNWVQAWIDKLRTDQMNAKADLAVLVTSALPKGIEIFGMKDGVFVVRPDAAVPVAVALRCFLIKLGSERQAENGKEDKKELLYRYCMGNGFRQKVQTIIDAFQSMENELNTERTVITKQWNRRKTQIERVRMAVVTLSSDLDCIAERNSPRFEALQLEALNVEVEENNAIDAPHREEDHL